MLVEVKKENLCINQIIGEKEEEAFIENDVIIPDVKPDILSAINTNCTISLYKKEILDGKVRLDGSLNLYIMYLPDSQTESIRTINTNLDFTQILEMEEARENMELECNLRVKNIECKVLNGRKINIKASMLIGVKLYSNNDIELITKVENDAFVKVLSDTMSVDSLIGRGETQVYAKENISIDNDDEIAEIMKMNLAIIDRNIKISYNKVLAKAELDVRIMYLTEDGRINTITDKIPIMGFIDIPNIREDNVCEISYYIKNVLVKINHAENHGIYIETPIELTCSTYEKKEINVIQDLYSVKDDVRFEKKLIKTMAGKRNIRNTLNIYEQIKIPEIIGHRLYDVEIVPVITGRNISKDKVIFDGNIKLKFTYEGENTELVNIKDIELQLNFNAEIQGISKDDSINSRIDVLSQDFVINQDGNIECKINLEYEINTFECKEINVIDGLDIEPLKKEKNYSMIIYFVKQGDTLWEIAKYFKSTVEDIIELNNIEEPNKIQVGQQLFIPKYLSKKSA